MKKITLLMLILVCAVGFGQTRLSDTQQNSPILKQSNSNITSVSQSVITNRENNPLVYGSKKAKKQNPIVNRSQNLVSGAPKASALGNNNPVYYGQNGNVSNRNVYLPYVNTVLNGASSFTSSSGIGTTILNEPAGTATRLANGATNSTRMPLVITHSNTQNIVANEGITCNTGGIANNNSFYRAFDLAGDFGIAGDFDVTDAEFGIETISGSFLITVNAYSWNTFPAGSGTLQGSGFTTINTGDAGTVVSTPLTATIPAGDILVYEILIVGDGSTSFFLGANQDGQTGPSYILAADCGATTPTDLTLFGLTNSFVMNIVGDEAGGGGGGTCSEANAGVAFDNAWFSGGDNFPLQVIATDLTVAADEDFELTGLNVELWFTQPETLTSVDIVFYGDAGGSPDVGNVISTQLGVVSTAEALLGNAFGFDIYSVDLDIAPVSLLGQAGVPTTYWVSIFASLSGPGDAGWGSTQASVVNLETSVSQDGGATWVSIGGGWDQIYVASGDCTPTGGGGGGGCAEENPNDFTFENGLNCSSATAFQAANDVTVADGEDFELSQITASIFANGGISLVDVIYYDNVGGFPGAVIGSEAGLVPTSQVVIGSNFGLDVNEILLDVTPFTFAGQNGSPTTYWIELSVTDGGSSGAVYWVVTSSSAVGNPIALFDGFWQTFDPAFDGVYIFDGACTPIVPDPTFDTCDGALPINCGDIVSGTTIGATVDSGVAPTCDTTVTAPGVWYKYEDTTGLITDITITMCNGTTDYDSKLSVYTGDCGAPPLTCVVGNDDTCGLQSEVSFQSDGATTFYILVHGFGSSVGNFEIEMICTPVPPPNDMIVNSIDVDQIGFPYTDPSVAMSAATTEAGGTPVGCDNAGVKGVWYNFVPEGDGTATASITSPAGFSSVTFYTAPNENAVETDLVLVDWFENQCLPSVVASIPTVAGQAYYVYVANHGGITDIVIDGTNLGVVSNTIAGFTYYPNPTEGTLNLSSVENIENVAIYNMLGQKVIDQNVNATTSELTVSALSTGAYLMKVSVNGQIGTYKILKK